jgi:hypothetical protein
MVHRCDMVEDSRADRGGVAVVAWELTDAATPPVGKASMWWVIEQLRGTAMLWDLRKGEERQGVVSSTAGAVGGQLGKRWRFIEVDTMTWARTT